MEPSGRDGLWNTDNGPYVHVQCQYPLASSEWNDWKRLWGLLHKWFKRSASPSWYSENCNPIRSSFVTWDPEKAGKHASFRVAVIMWHPKITSLEALDGEIINRLWKGAQCLYSLSGRTSYRKISPSSKPQDSGLNFSSRSEMWQTHRQQGCRDACQISGRIDHYSIQSHGFETSRDLMGRRLSA